MLQIALVIYIHPSARPDDKQAAFLREKIVQMMIDNNPDAVRRLFNDLSSRESIFKSFYPLPTDLLPATAPFIPECSHIFVVFAHNSGRYCGNNSDLI